MRQVTLCLILIALVTTVAVAQDLPIGMKWMPDMTVACVEKVSTPEAVRGDVEAALPALWDACRAAGLHPVGLPILRVDLASVEAGTYKWEAWLILADQLETGPLPEKHGLTFRHVPPARVGYTYHAGSPWPVDESFQRLKAWAGDRNFKVGTHARLLIYVWPGQNNDENTMVECELELRQSGGSY